MNSEWIGNNILLYTVLVVLLTLLVCYLWKKQLENSISAPMVKSTFAGTVRNKLYDSVPRDDGMTVVDLELENVMLNV
jgi:hypothetical protein